MGKTQLPKPDKHRSIQTRPIWLNNKSKYIINTTVI
jgi:hypothetical protein